MSQSNRPKRAKVTTNLPSATAATVSGAAAGPPLPVRDLRVTTRPTRGAGHKVCPPCELRPARAIVGPRGAADGRCTSPPLKHPNPPSRRFLQARSAPAGEEGWAPPALWRAGWASMGRTRMLHRAPDQVKARLKLSLDVKIDARHVRAWSHNRHPIHTISHELRPPGRLARPHTPHGEP